MLGFKIVGTGVSPSTSILTVITSVITAVTGATITVLAAGMIGAMIAMYFSREKEKIWLAAIGVLLKGIAGAWVASLLPHFSLTAFTTGVKPEVLAGLCAILIQSIYRLGIAFFESLINKYKEKKDGAVNGGEV